MVEVATTVRPLTLLHLGKLLTDITWISDIGNATFEPLHAQPATAAPANYGATAA